MCINSCGFFGSVIILGMCLKCYRDYDLMEVKELFVIGVEVVVILFVFRFLVEYSLERIKSDGLYLVVYLFGD